jgi:ABC-type transport system involved in multi-copper enzyme maturation permease subunit
VTRRFGVLAREALADAVRRRLVLAIAAVSLLSLQLVDSCTSCGTATVTRNGETIALPDMAGLSALAAAVACALWTLLLAGILASDHLADPLADGSANLVLARPVGRGEYALARLAGALAIALGAGALLLGVAGALLHARHGIAWWPVLPAFAACAAGAATVGALAMAASLALPRIATVLLVMIVLAAIAGVNLASLSGAQLSGIPWLIDRFGPPLASSVAFALAPWIEPREIPGSALAFVLRHAAWIALGALALVHSFRRMELR